MTAETQIQQLARIAGLDEATVAAAFVDRPAGVELRPSSRPSSTPT